MPDTISTLFEAQAECPYCNVENIVRFNFANSGRLIEIECRQCEEVFAVRTGLKADLTIFRLEEE